MERKSWYRLSEAATVDFSLCLCVEQAASCMAVWRSASAAMEEMRVGPWCRRAGALFVAAPMAASRLIGVPGGAGQQLWSATGRDVSVAARQPNDGGVVASGEVSSGRVGNCRPLLFGPAKTLQLLASTRLHSLSPSYPEIAF